MCALRDKGMVRTSTLRDAMCVALSLTVCITLCAFADAAHAQSITPATPATTQPPAQPVPFATIKKDITDGPPLSPSDAPGGNGSSPPANHAATGAAGEVNDDRRSLQDALAGIVTAQVITMTGQNFYRYFVTAWRQMPLAGRYDVEIREVPSARWGSLVSVEFGHRHLFEAFLSPARNDLKQIGERAAEIVYQKVVQTDLERLLFREQDLGPDEM